jgi:class I fructose-bisphosphate aldolase
MSVGKKVRLERISVRETGKMLLVPLDHGTTVGPIYGITDMAQTVQRITEGGANCVLMHKGMVQEGHRGRGQDVGLIVHLSASTSLSSDPHHKILVCTVEEAVRLGADAVSIHVNIGNGHESAMLRDFGQVSRECERLGIPLLAMMYPRGEKIKDEYDVSVVKHAARVGNEMGADIVKVSYTGSSEGFREVVAGVTVPVVIAGGEKMNSDQDILEMVKGAMDAGAAGTSIGRNVFQHNDPAKLVRAMAAIVHQGESVENAMKILEEGRDARAA